MISRRGRFERRLRYLLMIALIALAAAIVWLWVVWQPHEEQTFSRIYRVSVAQATGNFTLEAALGVPIEVLSSKAQYHFYTRDGRRHVRFSFPLLGSHGEALITGEAVRIGSNWLIISLAANLAHRGQIVNLTPNVRV